MNEEVIQKLYKMSLVKRKSEIGDDVTFFDYRKFAELIEEARSLESMNMVVGSNPLPFDFQQKLGELLDWAERKYPFKNGTTVVFWDLSNRIANHMHMEDTKK